MRRATIRTNIGSLALIAGSFVGFSATVVTVMGLWRGEVAASFAAGASIMSLGFLMWLACDSVRARRLFNAASAERFTSESVRRMRRHGWRCVDHVEFHRFDVDHVAAGPGGVFAIETKWTSESWELSAGGFEKRWAQQALDQCEEGAAKIALLLRGNYKVICTVKPLLVVWGPGRPDLHEPVLVNGVLVVPGPLLKQALKMQPPAPDAALGPVVIESLRHFVAAKAAHDAQRPRSGVGWSAGPVSVRKVGPKAS